MNAGRGSSLAPAERRKALILTAVFGSITLSVPAGLAWSAWRSSHIGRNDAHAHTLLKLLGSFQAAVRGYDLDKNQKQDYWKDGISGLVALVRQHPDVRDAVQTVMLNNHDLGLTVDEYLDGLQKADPALPDGCPFLGYWVTPLELDENGTPYLRRPDAFGFCAYPARHGIDGRRTFIVNEWNSVTGKDDGGRRALKWPSDEERRAGLWPVCITG